jgi:hypothetical protein
MLMATWRIHTGAEKRDREAVQRFFKQALSVVSHALERCPEELSSI